MISRSVVLALGALSIIDSLFDFASTEIVTRNTDVATRYSADYSRAFYSENDRFWNDYIRAHHLEGREIKYPYRTGFIPDKTRLYTSNSQLQNNVVARSRSLGNLGASIYRANIYKKFYG